MHSHHHRLYVPYAFGALYNHPLEGFLLDSCGAALAFELTGMSPRLGMWFFVFSTLKTSKRERESVFVKLNVYINSFLFS